MYTVYLNSWNRDLRLVIKQMLRSLRWILCLMGVFAQRNVYTCVAMAHSKGLIRFIRQRDWRIWFVLGLFIQQRELARHADELERASMTARQDKFFKIAESVKGQMGGITGMLFMSSLGPAGNGRYDREEMDAMFRNASSGDSTIFARLLLSMEKYLPGEKQNEGSI